METIEVFCTYWTFLTAVATAIWFFLPPHWKERIKNLFRRIPKKMHYKDMPSRLRTLLLDDIKFIDGPFYDYGFNFKIEEGIEANVPDDFKTIADRLKKENDERMMKGEEPVYSDLTPYAVHSIVIRRCDKESQDKKNERLIIEKPVCQIELRESSYFYSLVSIMAMNEKVGDVTIREKYYAQLLENPEKPAPDGYDVVHGFGINTLIYTNDGKFVFGERNSNTVATGQGCLHLSVGEHLNKMLLDFDEKNRPDIRKTLIRGIGEELGIKEKKDKYKKEGIFKEEDKFKDADIRFYGFALSTSVCQYGVLGFTHLINCSSTDIENAWPFSRDGHYENKKLVFIDADIRSIVNYLNKNPQSSMTKFALLNVCLTLMIEEEFHVSQKEIDKELKKLRPNALVG